MNNDEKYKYVLGMIKDSLHECVKNKEGDLEVGFFSDDFNEAGLTRRSFYGKLARAKKEGFIKSIKIPYEEDYIDDPESFPGTYVAIISPKFDATYKKTINNKNQQNQNIKSIAHDPGLEWEDISMRFIDGHNVEIIFNDDLGHKLIRSYEEFGCKNNRTTQPRDQWVFLSDLAENNGIISPKKNNCKVKDIPKRKQELSNTLMQAFEIFNSEPFEKCEKGGDYKIKIKVIPEGRNWRNHFNFNPNIVEDPADIETNKFLKQHDNNSDK